MNALTRTSASRALLIVGALTWLPGRWGVTTTWNGKWLGLDYVGWNRAMLVPLALLAVGAALAARPDPARVAAWGWRITAAGFTLAWAGVLIEFVVGGGLRGGPEILAMAGWGVYGLGTLVAAVGGLAVAWGCANSSRLPAAAAAVVAAAAMLSWLPLVGAGMHPAAVANQQVVGLAWAAVAVLGLRSPDRGIRAAPRTAAEA